MPSEIHSRLCRAGIVSIVTAAGVISSSSASGQSLQDLHEEIQQLRKEMEEQRRLVNEQQETIKRQAEQIDALSDQLVISDEALQRRAAGIGLDRRADSATLLPAPAFGLMEPYPGENSSAGLFQSGDPSRNAPPSGAAPTALPEDPVGEEPQVSKATRRAAVRAIPQEQTVLTPRGTLVFDPQIEYINNSTVRLVFRGFELVPGIQVGLIEASDADRDVVVASGTLRYGITERLEAEVRVPYTYRHDRLEIAQQRDQSIVRAIELEGNGIGDVEFGIRYQLNKLRPLKPVFIGSLRVKSNTGKSPFKVDYDEFGVATSLATGTGFWGIQPGISFLLPSDPTVIYGGVSYLYHMPRDIDRTVGGAFIGRVDPGDTVGGNIGFGFALNPQFSFSLGYKHTYVFPTKTEIGGTRQRSTRLHIGQFNFGMSVRVAQDLVANFGLNVGVTEHAPDVNVSLRLPLDFRIGS